MYGKIFSSTFSGSMFGAGPEVFAVWSYVIANAMGSRVELNTRMLAATIGTTPQKVEEAIEFLCSPDPDSRNPEHDGRRLVREGQYQFLVVSHRIYRGLKDEDERRAYNATRQRECREKKGKKPGMSHGDVTPGHTQSRSVSTSNSASAYASAYQGETVHTTRGFTVPDPEQGVA